MKTLKITDIVINLLLIISFLIQKSWTDLDKMINAYFIVGGWQVVSMLFHAYKGWFTKKWSTRYIYHWIVLVAVITIPVGSFWILAFTATPMAIFYTALCITEVFKIRNRPLSLLK